MTEKPERVLLAGEMYGHSRSRGEASGACGIHYTDSGSKPSLPFVTSGLPLDVLLIVFRYLLPMVKGCVSNGVAPVDWDESDLVPWSSYNSSMPDKTFTESLASVSPIWREAMSLIPSFWTRLVVWVGNDATPLSQVREYLAWSRDWPLDIYVLQKPTASESEDLDLDLKARVKAQVRAICELLGAHVRRWRVLRMELVHSSNLPRPRVDLVGNAGILETMQLIFDVDDRFVETIEDPSRLAELHTPELAHLIIGGLHFRELYVRPLRRFPMPPGLRKLSIFSYGAHHPPFPIYDLLSCLVTCDLKVLRDVELDNLQLDCSSVDPVTPLNPDLHWAPNMRFTDVTIDVIAEFNRLLEYPWTNRIGYTRCSTLGHAIPVADCEEIELNEIHDPQAILGLLIPRIEGDENSVEIASFYNCDGLRPEVFSTLSLPAAGPWRMEWLCPALTELTIKGCKHFTSADVRRFVEARYRAHVASGSVRIGSGIPGFVVSPLHKLAVRDCCELAPEDEEWLRENVAHFTWN